MRRVVLCLCIVCLLAPAALAQNTLSEARHWEAVAQDVVKSVVKSMKKQERTDVAMACLRTDDHSSFGRSLRTHLATALMDQGLTPTTAALPRQDCLNVRWAVQLISHRESPSMLSGLTKSHFTVMDYGVYKDLTGQGKTEYAGAGTTRDDYYAESFSFSEYTEVTVTTTIDDTELYLVRNSNTYYINDLDSRHYWPIPDIWEEPNHLPEKTYSTVTY